jgi:hypothetical protein
LYYAHKNGARIIDRFFDATEYQQYWLMLMSARDLNYDDTIDVKLTGIAKGLGIEFKKK